MIGFTQFIWTVDLSGANGNPQFDLNAGNAFFFGLFNSGTTGLFESQFINITGKNVIASTASSSSSSSSATTSVGSAASAGSATTTSILGTSSTSSITPTLTSASVNTEPSKGLSVGAKAGIGIGSVVAFLAFVGAAFGLGYLLRRPKTPHTHPEFATVGHSSFAPSTTTAITSASQQWFSPVEAPRELDVQKPENRIYEI